MLYTGQSSCTSDQEDKTPEWARQLGLVTSTPDTFQASIRELQELIENTPIKVKKGYGQMIRAHLRKFGPDTQDNIRRTLKHMKEFVKTISDTETLPDSDMPRFENIPYDKPSLELSICLKCRNGGHILGECINWGDPALSAPLVITQLVWQFVLVSRFRVTRSLQVRSSKSSQTSQRLLALLYPPYHNGPPSSTSALEL